MVSEQHGSLTASHAGYLISFDGVDSSGKETQAKRFVERLRYMGWGVHQFTTPDYLTPLGRELKARLQNRLGRWQDLSWQEKLQLFARNRAEHKAEVLAALARGEVVVYDRYVPSSLAFMTVEALTPQDVAHRRRDIHQAVEQEEYEVQGMPREQLSVFLDVPPEVSSRLLEHRKATLKDADEYTDHMDVQQRLYNEYDVMTTSDVTRYVRIQCVMGGELLGVEAVSELVWESVRARLPVLARAYGS